MSAASDEQATGFLCLVGWGRGGGGESTQVPAFSFLNARCGVLWSIDFEVAQVEGERRTGARDAQEANAGLRMRTNAK